MYHSENQLKFSPSPNLNESLDQIFSKVRIQRHDIGRSRFDAYVQKGVNKVSHADEIEGNCKDYRNKDSDSKLFETRFLQPKARR